MTPAKFFANAAVRAVLTALVIGLVFATPGLLDTLKGGAWPSMAAWSAAGAAFVGAAASALISAASMLFGGDPFSGSFVKS